MPALNVNKAEFIKSAASTAQFIHSSLPSVVFAGKSNVGKSSVINRMLNRKNFARVGEKPGKTVHVNYFVIDKRCYLVDLPGYGFAQAGKKQRAKLKMMIERYCLLREALVSLFVLIDCRHEPQQIDLEFMEWLGEQEIPFAIVFTKADKLSKSKLTINVDTYKQKLLETWAELPPIFVTSAEKGLGEAEVIAYIEGINRDIANQG